MRKIRYVGWSLLLLLPAAAVVFVLVDDPRPIDDAYAQWGASNLVKGYMEAHDGNWPPNWESLRPEFEKSRGRGGGSFEEFQRRIVIDFRLNAEDLRRQAVASDEVTFRAIYARSILASVMGEGPNAALRAYFRAKSGIIEAQRPHGGWPSPKHRQLSDEWYRRGFYVRFDKTGEIIAAWTSILDVPPPGNQQVAELRNQPKLKELNLVGSQVTDSGLEVLRHLPDLQELNLGGVQVTDAGLEHLSGHPGLQSLDLFGTQITDTGLQRLRELPALRKLRYDPQRISSEAAEALTNAMPNLKIRLQGELRLPVD